MDTAVEELVDLERYPLFDLDAALAGAVIEDARAQLADVGFVELEGFVHPTGVAQLVADAEQLAGRAHHSVGVGTAYLEVPPADLPDDHPRRWKGRFGVQVVPYDVIPYASPLRRLYESDQVLDLIARIVGEESLYRYGDPFGALNLSVMGDGDELQWHFDQTDFVVSLAIQSADSGGDFEVAPFVRGDAHHAYDDVASILNGTANGNKPVTTIAMNPGTLLVFMGRNSVHRVSPISGTRLRHVGLLAYDTKEASTGSDLLRQSRYGRTVAFVEPPIEWPI
ncbi:MAG: hypothetical protein WAM97_22580 [Acidimicrobiales bacterium]|jgi:hypothetical protein